jgi:hypothetical protein
MSKETTFDNIPMSLLDELAITYSIMPGTRYYFTKGHPSGLGGMTVYFPMALKRLQGFQFPSGIFGVRHTRPEQGLPARKTAAHPHELNPGAADRRYAQKPWLWLQRVKRFFHLSSVILLSAAATFSNFV